MIRFKIGVRSNQGLIIGYALSGKTKMYKVQPTPGRAKLISRNYISFLYNAMWPIYYGEESEEVENWLD